jgi:hypothetical protein
VKQTALAVVLAAAVSSVLTLLLASALRPPPAAPPSSLTASEFKAALGDLEREVATLRAALAERGAAGPAPIAAAAPGAAPTARGEERPAASATLVVRAEGTAAAPAAATLLQRLEEVAPRLPEGGKDYEAREEVLRRWILRPESEVHAWFGLPARIDANGEQERWFYVVDTGTGSEKGGTVKRTVWVLLNRGRVVDIGD